uniref:C2 domain-containing protein n=1 Tax=Daucus carota subsp. sativus TaxID=79200 RepID=A0A166FKF2_DAUCS
MDGYILNIHSIAAQGLSKASPYYARVSILGDHQITEWTTHVDTQGGNNPRWNQQRTIMLNKSHVHRELVYVVVKIFKKRSVLDKCVGQVRVPVGQTIDYETQRFALSRSKFQINQAKGAIKLACRIQPLQVTAAETHDAHHAQASSSSYQQGFWYPPPAAYYQPMPQHPQRPNKLGLGAVVPLVMMAANILFQ